MVLRPVTAPVAAYASSRLLLLAVSAGAGLTIVTAAEHFGPATVSWLFLLQAWSRPDVRAADERFGLDLATGDPEIDAGLALLLSGVALFGAFLAFGRWTEDRRALMYLALAPTTALLSAANWDSVFLLLAVAAFTLRGPARWGAVALALGLRDAGLALAAGVLAERLPRSAWLPVALGGVLVAANPSSAVLVLLGGLVWWKVGPGPGVYVLALAAWPGARLLDLAFPAALAFARLVEDDRPLVMVHGLALGLYTTLFVKGLAP